MVEFKGRGGLEGNGDTPVNEEGWPAWLAWCETWDGSGESRGFGRRLANRACKSLVDIISVNPGSSS